MGTPRIMNLTELSALLSLVPLEALHIEPWSDDLFRVKIMVENFPLKPRK